MYSDLRTKQTFQIKLKMRFFKKILFYKTSYKCWLFFVCILSVLNYVFCLCFVYVFCLSLFHFSLEIDGKIDCQIMYNGWSAKFGPCLRHHNFQKNAQNQTIKIKSKAFAIKIFQDEILRT